MTTKTVRKSFPKCSEENIFNYTPYPTDCPCCKGYYTVSLLTRDQFNGKWGNNMMAYMCSDCHAMVGADNAGVAMGVLGDEKTRQLRKEAHAHFDRLWKDGPDKKFRSRSAAYKALASIIDVEYDDCHFANMDHYTLTVVIKMLKANKV